MPLRGLHLTDPWTARRLLEVFPEDLEKLRLVQRAAHAMGEQRIMDLEEARQLHLQAQRQIDKIRARMTATVVSK